MVLTIAKCIISSYTIRIMGIREALERRLARTSRGVIQQPPADLYSRLGDNQIETVGGKIVDQEFKGSVSVGRITGKETDFRTLEAESSGRLTLRALILRASGMFRSVRAATPTHGMEVSYGDRPGPVGLQGATLELDFNASAGLRLANFKGTDSEGHLLDAGASIRVGSSFARMSLRVADGAEGAIQTPDSEITFRT